MGGFLDVQSHQADAAVGQIDWLGRHRAAAETGTTFSLSDVAGQRPFATGQIAPSLS
jgi:hypothetical protein